MRGMREAAVVTLGLLVASAASAQGPAPSTIRLEGFADVGVSNFINGIRVGEGGHDSGAAFGVRPLRGHAAQLGFEFRVDHMVDGDFTASTSDYERLRATLYGANALWHFAPGSRAQPYVFGGLGAITAEASRHCSTCQWDDQLDANGNRVYRETGSSDHGTVGAFLFGAGVKSVVAPHVSVRAELLFGRAFERSYNDVPLNRNSSTFTASWGWERLSIGVGVHF